MSKKLLNWFKHLKLHFLGSQNFTKQGFDFIPCVSCGKSFKSYAHHAKGVSDYFYDIMCEECRVK